MTILYLPCDGKVWPHWLCKFWRQCLRQPASSVVTLHCNVYYGKVQYLVIHTSSVLQSEVCRTVCLYTTVSGACAFDWLVEFTRQNHGSGITTTGQAAKTLIAQLCAMHIETFHSLQACALGWAMRHIFSDAHGCAWMRIDAHIRISAYIYLRIFANMHIIRIIRIIPHLPQPHGNP